MRNPISLSAKLLHKCTNVTNLFFGGNHDIIWGDLRLFQTLTAIHRGNDYVRRNVSDLGFQLMSAQGGNTTNQNETVRSLGNIAMEVTELLNKRQWGGQRTDVLGRRIKELSIFTAKKSQGNFDKNA